MTKSTEYRVALRTSLNNWTSFIVKSDSSYNAAIRVLNEKFNIFDTEKYIELMKDGRYFSECIEVSQNN